MDDDGKLSPVYQAKTNEHPEHAPGAGLSQNDHIRVPARIVTVRLESLSPTTPSTDPVRVMAAASAAEDDATASGETGPTEEELAQTLLVIFSPGKDNMKPIDALLMATADLGIHRYIHGMRRSADLDADIKVFQERNNMAGIGVVWDYIQKVSDEKYAIYAESAALTTGSGLYSEDDAIAAVGDTVKKLTGEALSLSKLLILLMYNIVLSEKLATFYGKQAVVRATNAIRDHLSTGSHLPIAPPVKASWHTNLLANQPMLVVVGVTAALVGVLAFIIS